MLTACRLQVLLLLRSRRTLLRVSWMVDRCSLTDGETDTSIEAPPSLLPARKYCDITGLEACTHSVCGLS